MSISGYYNRLRVYDIALSHFENSNYINLNSAVKTPDDQMSVFEHLQSEGLVKIQKSVIEITEKGKLKITSGGYRLEFIVRILFYTFAITGSISATTALLITLS